MSCQERSGFLFAHACERPAAWPCVRCGKPICAEHTRWTEAGNTCITCLKGLRQPAEDIRGDDPYLYWYWTDSDYQRTAYYDADDYRAFDEAGGPAEETSPETDIGGS